MSFAASVGSYDYQRINNECLINDLQDKEGGGGGGGRGGGGSRSM